ncbi:adenosine receptor A2a-like [Oculina patagonica]
MNNTNSNSICSHSKEFSMTVKIILSTWFGLTGLAAIIGNALVLWLIFTNRSLRTVSNLFLTSLAAADFLVGLVIDPVWISIKCLRLDEESYMQNNSETIGYLWIHTTVATTFNLCCVTMDRHIAIFYPLRYEDIVNNRRCYALIATVWFMSLVLPCLRFLLDATVLPTLWLSFTIITVLIPMIIIMFCSVRNLKVAAAQFKNITDNTLQNQEAVKRRKRNFKAAKTVSIVVGLFVVCWLPSLITSLVQYFSKRVTWYKVWTPVESLAFALSAINPFVYCFRNEDFYGALTRTFRFLRRRNSELDQFHCSVELN